MILVCHTSVVNDLYSPFCYIFSDENLRELKANIKRDERMKDTFSDIILYVLYLMLLAALTNDVHGGKGLADVQSRVIRNLIQVVSKLYL